MTIEIRELKDSRGGDGEKQMFRYVVIGTIDDIEIRDAVEGEAPLTYSGKNRVDAEIDLEHRGNGVWIAEVPYELPDVEWPEPEGGSQTVRAPEVSFDTTGGTHHIDHSIETVGKYTETVGIPPPEFGGMIGVNDGEVAGCDVVVPQLEWSERHYFVPSAITWSYIQSLVYKTGTTNTDEFRGFEAGEVLFLGARGSRSDPNFWTVEFIFSASENAQGLVVGEIGDIEKKGWQHLWVHCREVVDTEANMIVKKPYAVYVEQVYPETPFSTLGPVTSLPQPAVGQ